MPFKISHIKNHIIALFFFTLILQFAPFGARADTENNLILKINIEGNTRVNESSIRYYISNLVGKEFSPHKARVDIKKLYSLGYFDDIKVTLEKSDVGVTVTYVLKEKPFVLEIEIKGEDVLKKKDILEKLEIKKGTHFKKSILLKDIEKIKKMYTEKGYYLANVKVNEIKGKNNSVTLQFEISEGNKIHVAMIRFFGNKAYSEEKLQEIIDTKTKGFFSWATDSGTYQKDILKTDLLKLQSFYSNNGYIQFRVNDPVIEIDREEGRIYIYFYLTEGDQYRVEEIEVEGDEVYPEEKLREAISFLKGDIFDGSKFRRDVMKLTELYLVKGYAYAEVIPQTRINEENKTVSISLKVNRGNRIYIGRINISGNEKTIDKVIRREFRLKEGSLFDSSKLTRTRERLNNLGYFEKVDIKQKGSTNSDDMIDLNVDVTETSTGSISAGAGYSSVEKAMFFAQVSQRNFFGRGQKVSLDANISSVRKTYSLNLVEPYMFDKEFSGGVSLFNTESDQQSYSSRKNGGSLSLGKSLGEYSSGNITYRYNTVETYVDDLSTASLFVKSQVGVWQTSSLSATLSRDTRDDFFSPSKGYQTSFDGTYAGGFLTGLNFYKLGLDSSYYKSLYFDFVFMAHGRIGYADSHGGAEFPIFENYFLGGSSSLRGFSFDDVGPLDNHGDSLGGNASLLFNFELQYPFTKFVRSFVFYDRGQVYGRLENLERTTDRMFDLSNMRHSWGFGIKFFSPIGPISLAWGFKLDPKPGEDSMEFHFDIGRAF